MESNKALELILEALEKAVTHKVYTKLELNSIEECLSALHKLVEKDNTKEDGKDL
ncbi:hypothetical protein P872_18470 [Rhodonellum psychrophilum GCM71 = DSM 17998]|uniref:Uncharacterized protein n=2 Tax=Rhodonellum TaxID=336827 RepID=U5C0F4_9BACT|nr:MULTISPECIES: hypothetical protein [Rhodonellum]ERM82381.1 hypothetical protein P872_18470 [Rhodonellum psychrophilum GCM71 = DSM 17998]SDZ35575.1 hypothetical protein SAMN05444412_11150 [Rhodonellum ikkaensis]